MVHEAAQQIMQHPAWARVMPQRLGVCVGTTQGTIQTWTHHQEQMDLDPSFRPSPPSLADPAFYLARLMGATGPVLCPSMACATSTAAIGMGLDLIRRGVCDAVVAGGVDALSPFVYAGFASLKALDPSGPRPFDRDRAGLGLGEGAALVLLQHGASEQSVKVAGWGVSADANHVTGPDPTGSGVARAIDCALSDASVPADEVAFVSAHGTGTQYNDLMEAKALSKVFDQRVETLPVNSVKGAIGHTLAAAGGMEAVLCGMVLERDLIPPTTSLVHQDPEICLDVVLGNARRGQVRCAVSTSSGFGGINAALVFRR
jgi:3-oxoacyl-(acyl-carrier-protein) synthase